MNKDPQGVVARAYAFAKKRTKARNARAANRTSSSARDGEYPGRMAPRYRDIAGGLLHDTVEDTTNHP